MGVGRREAGEAPPKAGLATLGGPEAEASTYTAGALARPPHKSESEPGKEAG